MVVVPVTISITPKIYPAGMLSSEFVVKALEQKKHRDHRQKLIMRERRAQGKA